VKLQRLTLENYGVHDQQSFEFGQSGLHVIHGPNEAGKSTLLQGIREFLFGFKSRNHPYAPSGTTKKMLATGQVALSDGTTWEVTRRQGRKNAFRAECTETGKLIDESAWHAKLGGVDQNLFEQVFGFSLSELATGEESLRSANIEEALFGGGMGRLAKFKAFREEMNTEAERLFLPRGKNQRINKSLREIRQQSDELKKISLRPADYQQWVKEAKSTGQQLKQIEETTRQTESRLQHIERLQTAHPLWIKRNALRQSLAELNAPTQLSSEAILGLPQAQQEMGSLQSEIDFNVRKVAELEKQLAQIDYNSALLNIGNETDLIQKQIGKVRAIRRDLPLRTQEKSAKLSLASNLLRQIDPQLDLDDFTGLSLSMASRDKITSLAKSHARLTTELESLGADILSEKAQIEIDEVEIKSWKSASSELAATLRKEQTSFRAAVEKRTELGDQVKRLETEIGQKKASLGPFSDLADRELSTLEIPLEETIRQFESEFDAIAETVRDRRRGLAATEKKIAALRADHDHFEKSTQLVTSQALHATRTERDHLIQKIQQLSTQPDASTREPTLPELFAELESRVRQTDEMSDKRFLQADAQAQHAAQIRELHRLETQRQQEDQDLATALAEESTIRSRWKDTWRATGMDPASPREMLEIRNRLFGINEIIVFRRGLDQRLADYNERYELVSALLEKHGLAEVNDTEKQRITAIEEFLEAAQANHEAYTKAQVRLDSSRRRLSQLEARHKNKNAELERLLVDSREILSPLQALGEVDLVSAPDIVHALKEVQTHLIEANSLDIRINDMQSELKQFEADVATLADKVDRKSVV